MPNGGGELSGERVVLGRKDDWSKVGFQWTGAEPEGLYETDMAVALGAVWEGDELVVYNYPEFAHAYEHFGEAWKEDSD
ncbi:MAG: hypothetical protein M3164_04800 [Actinomycetota bacterium]|nr:hypothetical protein [Actinomycetota bacterium]